MKPSRWYYVLAILVFIVGVVSFVLFLYKNLNSLSNSLTQVVMPGKWDITLPMTGKYTIFHEYRSVVGNRVFYTEKSVSDLQCILTSKVTGSQVMLFRSSADSSYSFGGRRGVSVFEFNIEHPGTYEFSAQYPEGKEGPEVILAIGQGFMNKLFGMIAVGLAILFGSGTIGTVIAVVTFIKRQKAK
jgi:hypothetical protein